MVERDRGLRILSHVVVLVGIALVAFPIYVALIASSHTTQEIVQVPMPMLPGDHFLQTYQEVLFGGGKGGVAYAPVGRMMMVSLIVALTIALGKIAISLLSAFAIVYFR